MKISELGIGTKAEEIFRSEGIETLFPPQEQAVKAGIAKGKSTVVCTPTASGKTVIAELASLSAVKQGGQVVYLVPLRALASEKYKDFSKWEKMGFSVSLQMGNLDSKFLAQKNTADILIATAEKCDSILRSRPNWFRDVKLLVIDEIHLIGTDRGPTYEVLISKFKKMFSDIQILGLSATIGNADDLGKWLDAQVVRSTWRPVELKQRLVQGSANVMFAEAKKTADEGGQSLVFVNSRRSAEAVSDKFAEKFGKRLDEKTKKELEKISDEILDVLSPATSQCKRLANAVRGGAAFHHAGLPNEQRSLVENAFNRSKVKILTSTPTLAAGVNVNARKVIIRDIKRYTGHGLDYIPVLEYMQMCLPYGEKIITNKGIVPIGKIVNNKIKCDVLSYNEKSNKFEYKPIMDYHTQDTKKLIELTTEKGYRLKLTEEHPLRINKKWINARDVNVGDKIIFHKYNQEGGYVPEFFDLIPQKGVYVNGLGKFINEAKDKLGKRDTDLANLMGVDKKLIYHYKKGLKNMPFYSAIKLLKLLKYNPKKNISRIKTAYGSIINIPNKPTKDLLWLAGIIATDGNVQRTIDKRTGSEYIKLRVFNKNKKIIDKSKRIFEEIIEGKVYLNKRKNGLYECEIGSTLLASILKKHFGIPYNNKTNNVTTPQFLLNAPKELIGAYLAGVLDGDGSYGIRQNKKFPTTDYQRILFVSGSKEFATGIQELLLRLGIISKFECITKDLKVQLQGKDVTFNKPHYIVAFHKKSYIQKFAKYAKPVKCKIKAKYKNYHNLNKYYDNEDDFARLKIVSKTAVEQFNNKVYNIQVKDNESYIASGFLVHNCGRAGRPKFEKVGESVLLATNEYDVEYLEEHYINGEPEDIHSRLGIEPVLRMHVLASIASGFTRTKGNLFDFFSSTFFAYEYGVDGEFKIKIEKILRQLDDWGFIKSKGAKPADSLFVSASDLMQKKGSESGRLIATPLGARVAELYLDPETAHDFVLTFEDPEKIEKVNTIGLLELLCSTTELRPLLRVKKKEEDEIWGLYYEQEDKLLTDETDSDYLDRFKTSMMFFDWINERSEEFLLETYGIAPGLLRMKLASCEWLAYSCAELIPYMKTKRSLAKNLSQLQMRIKHGIKEELLPLVAIKGVGRVRARKLFDSGIKTKEQIKKADKTKLESLVGKKIAESIIKQI